MLTFDMWIAGVLLTLVVIVVAPFIQAHLLSLQVDLKPVPVRSRASENGRRSSRHPGRF